MGNLHAHKNWTCINYQLQLSNFISNDIISIWPLLWCWIFWSVMCFFFSIFTMTCNSTVTYNLHQWNAWNLCISSDGTIVLVKRSRINYACYLILNVLYLYVKWHCCFVSVEVLYLVLEALSMNKLQVATDREERNGRQSNKRFWQW